MSEIQVLPSVTNADVKLHSELDRYFCFASDDRSDKWLADVDNTVRDRVRIVLKHICLLFKNLSENSKKLSVFFGRDHAIVINQIVDIPEITAEILKLFLDGITF